MKLSTWMTVIAATTGLALAQDVRNNFDAQADFSKFKTYKWVENKASEKPDDLTDSANPRNARCRTRQKGPDQDGRRLRGPLYRLSNGDKHREGDQFV